MSDTPIYDRLAQPKVRAQVFWAPVDAFEDPDAPTLAEIERMFSFGGAISFYYEDGAP